MIFLFFGSSIAHLEPELQHFEDWSIFVGISATTNVKSSKFNAQDDGHIQSGPTVKVWSHGGFILTSTIAKNCLVRLKKCVPQDSKKFPRSNVRVFRVQGTHSDRNNCKIK